MSFVILRISSDGTKLKFREIEKAVLKICLLDSHLSFKETSMNKLIYIYIYITNDSYYIIKLVISTDKPLLNLVDPNQIWIEIKLFLNIYD